MIILKTSDFTSGFLSIGQSATLTPKIQAAIDDYEKRSIYEILSNNNPAYPIGFGDIFINDCSTNAGVPIIARNLLIFNAMVQQDGSRIRQSRGMKDVIASMVFYYFTTDWAASFGQGGVSSSNMDTQNKADYQNTYRFAERRFNRALESIETIQWWLKTGNSNGGGNAQYPEYIQPPMIRAKFSDIL
jgi:hypothetical protein